MWWTSGRASGRKTLLQYSSLTPLERECYEGEVQLYRKTNYKHEAKLSYYSILSVYL